MKKYKQLTSEQRYQICGLKQADLKQSQIAEKVGVDKSTISREFRRNKGQRGWRPRQAQSLCDERKQVSLNGKRFSSYEWAEAESLIREDLSPEQAADRRDRDEEDRVRPPPRLTTSMRHRLLHTVTVLLLATSAAAHAGNRGCGVDWDYVPDAPGRAALEVSRGAMTGYYRLTKPESVAFDQSLQKIHDVVLAQPHLRPPRGIDLEGWIRQWKSPVCGERDERKPCLGVPVAGEGHMHYSYFFNINGKPQTVTEGWKNANWSINDLGSAQGGGAGAEVSQLGFSLQLTPHGQIDGVPVFKNPATQTAVIVFARSGRPPWTQPVSQQEYLEAAILRLEQEAQKEAALQNESPPTDMPAAQRQRTWQHEAAARQQELRKLLDETGRSDPALADTLRRNFEQLETDMAAAMHKDVVIEQQKAARAAGRPAPPKALTMADRLVRHRELLAAMPPAERQAQAVFMSAEDPLDPPLAPPGKRAQGYPLMQPNPDYFDPRLPRTALQIVTLKFGMGHLRPLTPDECGALNPGDVALWKTIHETPWQRVRALLAP